VQSGPPQTTLMDPLVSRRAGKTLKNAQADRGPGETPYWQAYVPLYPGRSPDLYAAAYQSPQRFVGPINGIPVACINTRGIVCL